MTAWLHRPKVRENINITIRATICVALFITLIRFIGPLFGHPNC